jgi:O-antigen ligase
MQIPVGLLLLACGLLFSWLTPTRGYHDLNYLPELAVVLSAAAAALVTRQGVSGPVRVSVWPAMLMLWPLCMVLLTLARRLPVYPEMLVAPVVACVAGLLLIGVLDQARAAGQALQCDRILRGTVLTGAVLTAATVLVQARLLPDPTGWVILPPVGIVPFSNFHQRNLAALLMSMGIAALWHLAGVLGGPARWLLGTLGTLVLTLALALTQSRAGVLLPVIGLLCLGPLAQQRADRVAVLARWLGPVLTVVACQILVAWVLQHGPGGAIAPGTHLGGQRLAEGEGLAMRWQIILHGLRQWLDHPVLGGGWGSHPGWLYLHAEQLPWPRYSTHTHNLVTQLLGETGLLGLLPLAAVFGALAGWILRPRTGQANAAPPAFPAAAPHLAFVVVLLLHSMVEYPLWNTYFLLPFVWSVVRLAHGRAPALEWTAGRLSTALRLGGVTLLVGSGVLLWGLMGAIDERLAAQARHAQAGRVDTPPIPVAGQGFFADVVRYADPVTDSRLAVLRRPLGERLALAAPMDWILERLAVDQALAGDAAASATSYVRLCAMYRHRCASVLARLETLSGQAALFVQVRAEVLRRVGVRRPDDYDLPLMR